jgi:hypothetical protein
MFQNTEIIFVSASVQLLEAAKSERFHTLDPAKEAATHSLAEQPLSEQI